MKRAATGKGARKRPKRLGPQTDREKLFCERWLVHYDKDRAYREAGYSINNQATGHLASSLLAKFADYLRPIQEAKAKLVAERLMVDSDQVLEAMVKRVFFDPSSFYDRTSEPLTELVKVKGRQEKVEQVMMWDGKPVYGERLKPYSELTPEQRLVVEITNDTGERIRYRLPTIREQHLHLTSLGRQFGLFAEKLIMERHLHKHTHHHLDFKNVPTQKIQQLTRQMLPLVGLEFAQQLGFTPEEVQAAADEGVVIEHAPG